MIDPDVEKELKYLLDVINDGAEVHVRWLARLDMLEYHVQLLLNSGADKDVKIKELEEKIEELEEKVKDFELDISSVDLQGLDIEIDKGRAFSKNWSIDLIDRWEFETLEERVQRLEG